MQWKKKIEIARRHLIPKQQEAHGLKNTRLKIGEKVLEKIIQDYTRESGVRELDRQLASIMRYQAKQLALKGKVKSALAVSDVEKILGRSRHSNETYKAANMPGVAVGLAYTYVGGDILFIEATSSEGKSELLLTGNLGTVMKESATTALSYLSSNARKYGIDPKIFETKTMHIHVPEGAVPKDGPSAGVTMLTALASAITGRKVRSYVGMTGEITLRGQVLPVGAYVVVYLSRQFTGGR